MSYIEKMFSLADKTVILTGGGGVIAHVMADAFLKSGARVVLWDISSDALADAVKRLVEKGAQPDKIHTMVVDAMSEEATEKALTDLIGSFGMPNVLINAAGGNRGKSAFIETDLKAFEFVLRLNLVAGLMVPTKVIVKTWIQKGVKGSIINLASMSSYIPLSGIWAYDAAKSAVLNLTMATAKEFAPHGIRVNAIAPGFIIGKQNKDLLIKNEATGELTERGQSIISRTPFGRFADAEELAGAVIFLTSAQAAGFITGITLPVDGGYLVDNI
jgi:NAD(P)-dependent dehydrogenase (short-subunit alcohol dehydrogenase family)